MTAAVDLANDQPLELKLRPPENDANWLGGCWFGATSHHELDGMCRRNPAPDSLMGLCPEHRDLLRAWGDGANLPDPRPAAPWRNPPEAHLTAVFPDLYDRGLPVG